MEEKVRSRVLRISYSLARLPIGMSMLGHGLIRFTKLQKFSDGMAKEFSMSPLPSEIVVPFSHLLPFIEFTCGLFLVFGLFTRFAAVLGVITMTVLIFGSAMIEQWNNVFTQIVYGAYFCALYRYAEFNCWAIDNLLFRSPLTNQVGGSKTN